MSNDHEDEDLDSNLYGYVPSLAANGVFLALFTISTILHIIQSFKGKGRYKWMYAMILGGLIEILGYGARVWSGHDYESWTQFFVQTLCLVLAPTLFSGVLYEMFEVLIALIQPQRKWLHPKISKTVFAVADLLSVGCQLAGAGFVARATTLRQIDQGSYTIAAGIAWQLFVMVGFIIVGLVWYIQVRKSESWKSLNSASSEEEEDGSWEKGRLSKIVVAVGIASACIIIRGVYRVAEFTDGFDNVLGDIEGVFWGLESIPILICMITLNIYHPNVYLPIKKKKQKHDYLSAFAHLTADSKRRSELRASKNLGQSEMVIQLNKALAEKEGILIEEKIKLVV